MDERIHELLNPERSLEYHYAIAKYQNKGSEIEAPPPQDPTMLKNKANNENPQIPTQAKKKKIAALKNGLEEQGNDEKLDVLYPNDNWQFTERSDQSRFRSKENGKCLIDLLEDPHEVTSRSAVIAAWIGNRGRWYA